MAVPPDAIESARAEAPESLRIEITRVTQQLDAPPQSNRWVRVEVCANVLAVHRTRAGVKPGDRIVIRWTLHSPRQRAVGDFPTLVDVDGVYDACLASADGAFSPAAWSGSFISVPPPLEA